MSRYRFIEVEKVNHAVRTLCRVLQVSRAAYYHWAANRFRIGPRRTPGSLRRSALSTPEAGRPMALRESRPSSGPWVSATPASGWPG
jgi:hypothetical protein